MKFYRHLLRWLRTIQGRLTIWFIGSLLIIFTGLLLVTLIVVWQLLNDQVDHHLHVMLNEVERIWHEVPADREALIRSIASSQGMMVIVLAPDGEVVFQTAGPDLVVPAQHELQQHIVNLRTGNLKIPHHFSYGDIRFALIPTPLGPGQGTIAVGYSIEVIKDTFRQAVLILGGLLVIFVIPLVWIGHLIAKKALSPVAAMTATARQITSSGDLKGRIPDKDIADELGNLTKVLNSMLDKLQNVFDSQQQFFSDAAHTLKTPLTVIRAQAENIASQIAASGLSGSAEAKLKGQLERLLTSLDQAGELVKDLLLLSQTEARLNLKKDKVDLSRLLEQVTEVAAALAEEKDIRIEPKIDPKIFVLGDGPKLLRALLNLIDNAIKYTPAGGLVKISGEARGAEAIVIVSDTGRGIPGVELRQVFNRFFRGTGGMKSGSGSGLGLAITKAVIEGHQGTILLESELGQGTTVTIKLPRPI
jgi:signal transduction histidine kinase